MKWWRMRIICWSAPSKLPWSQKMCCVLAAGGKARSMVAVRVYPKFSRKPSAVSIWEATNLVTESFIQNAFFGSLHPLYYSGFISLSLCWAVLNQDTELTQFLCGKAMPIVSKPIKRVLGHDFFAGNFIIFLCLLSAEIKY